MNTIDFLREIEKLKKELKAEQLRGKSLVAQLEQYNHALAEIKDKAFRDGHHSLFLIADSALRRDAY